MNLLRRYTLHPLRSRHNPLTKIALTLTLFVLVTAAHDAALELLELRHENETDKAVMEKNRAMIEDLTQFAEGKAKLIEHTGNYTVERSVVAKTYEVR